MRILDTKNPDLKPVVATAPKLTDYLGEDTLAHFEGLKSLLTDLGIPFTVNTTIVRGLDYYTHTVFEWITDALGAQGTVCGGGRYDGLVELLGGKPTQGIGFALGLERLIGLLPIEQRKLTSHVCVLPASAETTGMALFFANTLREAVPGLRVETLLGAASLKNLLKRADKSGATFAVVIGEEEKAENTVILKALRDNMAQARWPIDETLFQFLAQQVEP